MRAVRILPALLLLAAASAAATDDEKAPPPTPTAPAAASGPVTVPGVRDVRALEREVRELRADINVLNLVNGLHLTPHQIVHVLRAAREAKTLLDEARPPGPDAKDLAEAARRLEEVRDALLAGKEPPEGALRAAETLPARGAAAKRGFAEVSKGIAALEDRVEAEMLDSQKEVLRTYKPCLVPPKDLRDPVRVGQADDAGPMMRLLDQAVSIPAERWESASAVLIEKVIEKEQEHVGKYGPGDAAARRGVLREAFEEARELARTDYEMRKEGLAERVRPVDRAQDLHHEIEGLVVSSGRPGKLARILLEPRVIPILQKRLDLLRRQVRDPVSLEAVKAAENCEGGHCAIR